MVLDAKALQEALQRSLSKFSQLERYLGRPRQLRGPGNRMFSMDNLTYREYAEQVLFQISILLASVGRSCVRKRVKE